MKIRKIAHRGSKDRGIPENSLLSFQYALDCGADAIEMDLWLSKDGKVFVFHDDTLDRMMSCSGSTLSLTFEDGNRPQLNPVDKIGQMSKIDNSITPDHSLLRVPLLEEVLQVIPKSVCIMLEFKMKNEELYNKTHEILLKDGRISEYRENYPSPILWFSLLDGVTPALRKINPNIPTAASVLELLKAYIGYCLFLAPFTNYPYDILGLPLYEINEEFVNRQSALKHFPSWSKKLIAHLFGGKGFIRPMFINHLQERGIPCWSLGVDNADKLLQAESARITGLLTDDIGWLCDMMHNSSKK